MGVRGLPVLQLPKEAYPAGSRMRAVSCYLLIFFRLLKIRLKPMGDLPLVRRQSSFFFPLCPPPFKLRNHVSELEPHILVDPERIPGYLAG